MSNRKAWVLLGLGCVVFVVGNACSDQEDGVAASGEAGDGGEPTERGGSAGEPATAGSSGTKYGGSGGVSNGASGGVSSGASGGVSEGGSAGSDGGGLGGVAGCGLSDECGGCSAGAVTVKCTWGEGPSEHGEESDYEGACERARQFFDATFEGGSGGGGANSGHGGAFSDPGVCATYVSPGTRITGCDGCTETESESKRGQCVIRDECCVVIRSWGCST